MAQSHLLEALHPHAQPADAQLLVAQQAGQVKGARVRLHGDLRASCDAQVLLDCVQYPCQQLWGHQGGCLQAWCVIPELLQRAANR